MGNVVSTPGIRWPRWRELVPVRYVLVGAALWGLFSVVTAALLRYGLHAELARAVYGGLFSTILPVSALCGLAYQDEALRARVRRQVAYYRSLSRAELVEELVLHKAVRGSWRLGLAPVLIPAAAPVVHDKFIAPLATVLDTLGGLPLSDQVRAGILLAQLGSIIVIMVIILRQNFAVPSIRYHVLEVLLNHDMAVTMIAQRPKSEARRQIGFAAQYSRTPPTSI